MMRRIVGALTLGVLCVSGAQAQFTESSFHFVGYLGDSPNNYDSYLGAFGGADDANLGAGFPWEGFQVWCVDEARTASQTNYEVWVTPMSSSAFPPPLGNGYTYGGADGLHGQPNYLMAAALASLMNDSLAVNQHDENVQYAIWQQLGYTVANTRDGFDQGMIDADVALATANLSNIVANQWIVITAFDPVANAYQEFIAQDLSRPENVTPEPGVMSLMALGLVGLGGATLRRRRARS